MHSIVHQIRPPQQFVKTQLPATHGCMAQLTVQAQLPAAQKREANVSKACLRKKAYVTTTLIVLIVPHQNA
jgi:hypothetical protein